MAATSTDEVAHDFFPNLKIYKDGCIKRTTGIDVVPPSLDPKTGVESKDVILSSETSITVRLYIPKSSAVAGQ